MSSCLSSPRLIWSLQDRLHKHKYATLEALESDVKRMIQNARDFNERDALITHDAERLRKVLAAFMPKHNPRYLDPTYKAAPTPIPAHIIAGHSLESDVSGDEKKQPLKIKLTNKRATEGSPATNTSTPIPTSAKSLHGPTALPSFEGMDFQRANELIIQEMIELKDEESVLVICYL